MINIPFNRIIRLVCGVVLCTFMFACSNSSDTSVQPTYTSLWDNVFSGCAINCHMPSAADYTELGPDMSTKASFYTQVVGKSISDYPSWPKNSNCDSLSSNVSFIKAGNANDSSLAAALIQSVSDTLAANYNCVTAYNVHVLNNMAINDSATQNALITWINDGANNN